MTATDGIAEVFSAFVLLFSGLPGDGRTVHLLRLMRPARVIRFDADRVASEPGHALGTSVTLLRGPAGGLPEQSAHASRPILGDSRVREAGDEVVCR